MQLFTETETKILNVLADGMAHDRAELLCCLDSGRATRGGLAVHIFNIRKKLKSFDQYVSCELHGYSVRYRHVQLLKTALPKEYLAKNT